MVIDNSWMLVRGYFKNFFSYCRPGMGKMLDGPSNPSYEQVLDSLAMIARHTPVPLLEALLKWRER
jgi:hypothetical protein